MSSAAPTADPNRPSMRVLEALIIAALTSVAVYISAIPRLETKIEGLERHIQTISEDVSDIRRDVYVPASRYQSSSASGQK